MSSSEFGDFNSGKNGFAFKLIFALQFSAIQFVACNATGISENNSVISEFDLR